MALGRTSILRHNLVSIVCITFFVIIFLCTQPALDSASLSTSPRLSRITGGRFGVKTSQLHFIIPASHTSERLCYNLVSAAANRYPAPQLMGWHGVGELDASKTHLAKLRAIMRYLDSLGPAEDDDLVLVVDAYDVIHQLPPQVMIERYFDIAHQADIALAKRFDMTLKELHSRNLRQTVFWGPDKICFPHDPRAPRCWAVPPSPLAEEFGPNSGNGDMEFNDPHWLNSGTVMGPVDDMRRVLRATMAEIDNTWDANFQFRESDQYYVSNVWAKQEYWRSLQLTQGADVAGGPSDRFVPETRLNDSDAELHIAIEYESSLFQTKAAYNTFFGYLEFSQAGHKANMSIDVLNLGQQFKPYEIDMPMNVLQALTQLFDSVPEAHAGVEAKDWIRTVKLGVNYVSKQIYGLWHCTGDKQWIDVEYPLLWWYPYAESLVKAAVKSSQNGQLISSKPIAGRKWASKAYHAGPETPGANEYGGAWSDEESGRFVGWGELCGPYEGMLFQGERGAGAPPEAGTPLTRRSGR
ncbi:hypothetical protein CDD81_4488 [Ophiocordyceps australis]|uniref:Uncharacterized protein n=1 Tax=Ophiocordyceps australis TaxID=1399860 RepID=A0A2C5YHJ6_9HYPO|nr:hypothetical protein CDD81_4488 [Ophiocordyceps australis]